MNKYSFADDYSEGCHPEILTALADSNMSQQTAYGDDDYTCRAKDLIGQHLGKEQGTVFLVAGGTLANIIIIAASLRPHEAVIAAQTGHIVVRETGAIEATGHKIITAPSNDGKLTREDIQTAVENNAHFPHMTKPRLVYISNATEVGTLYTKTELTGLSEECRAHNLLLLLDGARLGAALSAESNDLTLEDITRLTDAFWIGGTKAGALIGEAIVINNKTLAEEFSFHIKQRGALLAKGRLLGIQFCTLFKSNLFFDLTRHGNTMARALSQGITSAGYQLAAETQINQIFPILPNSVIDDLQTAFDFYIWEKVDSDHAIIRLVTSWATQETQIEAFLERLP